MLNTISRKFHAWTTGWRVMILLVAFGLMMGHVMPLAGGILALAANNSVTPLDLMFLYTPEQAFDMIEKYGEAGRSLYFRIEPTADILYPITYTLFFGLLLSMLSMYPAIPSFMAWVTMLFGTLKWGLFVVTVGLVLVGLVRAALNRFRKQA